MNKKNLLIEVVLAILVVWLFVDKFNSGDSVASHNVSAQDSTVQANDTPLKLAYINIDSLLLNYTLAQKLNAQFTNQQKQSQRELEKKMNTFQNNYQAFQEKVQTGGFLTQASAEAQQQELLAQQQQLEQLNQQLSNDLMIKEQQLNKELYDTISFFVTRYNKQGKYDLILSNTMIGTVMYGKADLNITGDVLRELNLQYEKSVKK